MSADHSDDDHICVNCQLARALTEWRDSGAPVKDIVEAVADMVRAIVFAQLDEIFDEPEAEGRDKASH
jgi:hypothetical protein